MMPYRVGFTMKSLASVAMDIATIDAYGRRPRRLCRAVARLRDAGDDADVTG